MAEQDALMKFDVQVANFPFSLDKWGAEGADADRFHRFHRGVPPKSKGDYAFISHMIESAKEDGGKVGVFAPHGVLFRGGAEGRIRKALIEENLFDAVIGLPPGLFYGTGIPAVILLFKKGRARGTCFSLTRAASVWKARIRTGWARNTLRRLWRRTGVQDGGKYAYRATRDEIAENDYNLNLPRYVDTFEPEEKVDLAAVQKEINGLEQELASVRKRMAGYLKDLGV